jgi:hypothetical protein
VPDDVTLTGTAECAPQPVKTPANGDRCGRGRQEVAGARRLSLRLLGAPCTLHRPARTSLPTTAPAPGPLPCPPRHRYAGCTYQATQQAAPNAQTTATATTDPAGGGSQATGNDNTVLPADGQSGVTASAPTVDLRVAGSPSHSVTLDSPITFPDGTARRASNYRTSMAGSTEAHQNMQARRGGGGGGGGRGTGAGSAGRARRRAGCGLVGPRPAPPTKHTPSPT